MMRLLVLAVLVPLFGALAGCGPVQSTAFLLDADVNLQAAKTAGAEKHAPYEYTAAALYLHKAREEVGYSDFQAAVDYSQKASKFANEARSKALTSARGEEVPLSAPPPTSPDAP